MAKYRQTGLDCTEMDDGFSVFSPLFGGSAYAGPVWTCCIRLFLLWDRHFGSEEDEQCEKRMLPWVAGALFLIAHPVITEQFYFSLQSVEICISMILTAVALYLIDVYGRDLKKQYLVYASLILIFTFSVYQSFVILFIFGTVSILFADSVRTLVCGKESTVKEQFKKLLPYLGVFFTSFIVNTVITKLFFSSSDYLGGQIIWGEFPVIDNLRAIAGYVVRAMTGMESVHYHYAFGLLNIAVIWQVIVLCSRFGKKKKEMTGVILFYLFALLVTPFLLTGVCGGTPAVRSQLVLPFVTGFLAYLNVTLFGMLQNGCGAERTSGERNKTRVLGAVLLTVICVTGIWGETKITMSLYYTDRMRYEQDAALGRELITQIHKISVCHSDGEKIPVAIIGQMPFQGNNACVVGETIGKSFFAYDAEVEPEYYWSTRRMLGFLHTLGADFEQANMQQFGTALEESRSMTVWPADGCIRYSSGMIIIKLGEVSY